MQYKMHYLLRIMHIQQHTSWTDVIITKSVDKSALSRKSPHTYTHTDTETHTDTDRHTHRYTHTQKHTHTDNHRETKTDRDTHRVTETHT